MKENTDTLPPLEYAKDSPTRSILKAISWRLIASGTTFIVTFIVFSNTSGHNMDQALETAWYVTVVEFSSKILIYYLHERLWTNIRWGKYWRRSYWKQRNWKRLYRRMHNVSNKA
jgi:uncharacterized membrane protein